MSGLDIAYAPADIESITYCSRIAENLAPLGNVQGVSLRNFALVLGRRAFRRLDIILLNWIENGLIDRWGRITIGRFARLALKMVLLRLCFRKVVFVRHNHFPHDTLEQDQGKARWMTDRIERLCHAAIVHSPTEVGPRRHYVPHPLYKVTADRPTSPAAEPYFIAFGRIVPYKRLKELIAKFPVDKRLVVAGVCDDPGYLVELRALAGDNVRFHADYLPDHEAQALVANSEGLIISHADRDMIVSASFFYAMSVGTRVLCLASPFLCWAQETLGPQVVRASPDVDTLCRVVSTAPANLPFDGITKDRIGSLFGDAAVRAALVGSGLIVK